MLQKWSIGSFELKVIDSTYHIESSEYNISYALYVIIHKLSLLSLEI